MSLREKFSAYKKKNTIPGVDYKTLNNTFNVQSKDSLFIAPDLSGIRQNISDATGISVDSEDIFKYPIRNTILQTKNNQGENLLGSYKISIIPKADIKKKK